MCEQPVLITAVRVSEEDRLGFLPVLFGVRWMIQGEVATFRWLSDLSSDYNGGYWHYYTLSNGGGFMSPAMPERLQLTVAGSWFDGELSADAAGIVVTVFALLQLAGAADGADHELLLRRHDQLLAYVLQHPERDSIRAAID